MKLRLLFMTGFLLLAGIFSYQITYALFLDTATSTNNTFTAASEFPITSPVVPGNIVINEVSPLGVAATEWIEIYNSGGTAIDVSGWILTDASGSQDAIPSSTPLIQPNSFAVIVGNTSTTTIPTGIQKITLPTATIGDQLTDSGDSVILKNGLIITDQMSYGTNTSIFSTPPSSPTTSQTLRRIPNGSDTNAASNWSNGASSIGVAN